MYDKNDIKEILDNIKILIDTREKKNLHIISYLKKNNIQFESKKLDFGDYSAIVLPNQIIKKEISFEKRCVIERKADLTELSGNIFKNRERFKNELEKSKMNNCDFTIMVESGNYDNIVNGYFGTAYMPNINPKSYIATLFSFEFRYNIKTIFLDNKEMAGSYIYNKLKYYIRECIINKNNEEQNKLSRVV